MNIQLILYRIETKSRGICLDLDIGFARQLSFYLRGVTKHCLHLHNMIHLKILAVYRVRKIWTLSGTRIGRAHTCNTGSWPPIPLKYKLPVLSFLLIWPLISWLLKSYLLSATHFSRNLKLQNITPTLHTFLSRILFYRCEEYTYVVLGWHGKFSWVILT